MNRVTTSLHENLARLRANEQRGSKPRCHFLTHGPHEVVANELTSLITPYGSVLPSDRWMPEGFELTEEAQLHKALRLIGCEHREALKHWWLADPRPTSRTPNWDIASTCLIEGRPGLLLVEAKAHWRELTGEECGKRRRNGNSEANECSIARAIAQANEGLCGATGMNWNLSADRCYQMSNRFAWAWKLCTLGYSVAIVYLGFIGARDMSGSFESEMDWDDALKAHSTHLFPTDMWERTITVSDAKLIPLSRTRVQALGG